MRIGGRLCLLALALLPGCSGEDMTTGLGQPLRVKNAQFTEGKLPGLPALSAEQVNAGVKPTTPNVASAGVTNNIIAADDPGRVIRGQASADSVAVGVRFADAGSGYWVVPTSTIDPLTPEVIDWSLEAAFDRELSPGLHRLLFAALDARSKSGTQGELKVCITPTVPDNGNACDPSVSPPNLVVQLEWDAPVDLDLRVITPSGKLVDSKHPTSVDEDENGKVDPSAEGAGVIDHDAFAHCQPVSRRRESLVFQTNPTPGTYLIYANLYDACDQPDVHFDVSLHVAEAGTEENTFKQTRTFHQAGQLQAVHANGGAKLGMFLTSFVAH